MNNIPKMNYQTVVRKLEKAGWAVVRKRGKHIRLERQVDGQTLRVTVPAKRSIKTSTLAHILES